MSEAEAALEVEASGISAAEPENGGPGWVRHLGTDSYHEVEDVHTVLTAYPGQYERMDAPSERSRKIGWPKAAAEAEAS